MTKKISILTALLVSFVALSSFSLSYSSLRALALENGISGPLSYLWPILIDCWIIVIILRGISVYLQSEKTWKQWAIVGFHTILTVGLILLMLHLGKHSNPVAGKHTGRVPRTITTIETNGE